MLKERDEIKQQIETLLKNCAPLLEILKDEQQVKQLREKNEFTLAREGLQISMLDDLYALAKLKYETGQYEDAAALLYDAKLLYLGENTPIATEKAYKAAWGKLAAEILSSLKSNSPNQWEAALEDLNELREFIENTYVMPLMIEITKYLVTNLSHHYNN